MLKTVNLILYYLSIKESYESVNVFVLPVTLLISSFFLIKISDRILFNSLLYFCKFAPGGVLIQTETGIIGLTNNFINSS